MREEFVLDGIVWPCTVFRSRYGGVYEGGEWVAAATQPGDPRLADATDEDLSCQGWFAKPPVTIAAGSTPDEAIQRLTALVASVPETSEGA